MAERGARERDGDLLLSGGNRIPGGEIEELASRSGGPGGQHVNTANTRVTLRWNVRDTRGIRPDARLELMARLRPRLSRGGVLIVHADRHRSRARNREMARERLRALVEAALHRAPARRPTAPTRNSKTRRLEAKRRRSRLKSRRRLRSEDLD